MVALHDATALVMASADGPALADDLSVCVRRFVPLMAQQAVEKIDRTRGLAAKLFADLVFHQPPVPGIPAREKVLQNKCLRIFHIFDLCDVHELHRPHLGRGPLS